MLKSLREVMYHSFYENNSEDFIRKINLPNYYVFGEMLDLFLELHAGYGRTPEPHTITVLCVTYSAFRIAINKGFNAIYLYDILDFHDEDYYPKVGIPSFGFVILESADTISYSLIKKLHEAMNPNTYFYVFYDSYIPRRLLPEEDILNLVGGSYNVMRVTSDKNVMNVYIRHFLNLLRQRQNSIDFCLAKDNKNIDKEEITRFDLALHLDISRPIITPHITITNVLNNKIRNYLGLNNQEDSLKPQVGEWLVCERGVECIEVGSGKKHTLPIGFRFQCTDSSTTIEGAYLINFKLERPDGEVVDVYTYAAKRYLEYMTYGRSDLHHPPYSYCINYGYVIPAFYSVNQEYPEGTIIFDGRLSQDKQDFYSCILPIKKHIKIYYNLKQRIEI